MYFMDLMIKCRWISYKLPKTFYPARGLLLMHINHWECDGHIFAPDDRFQQAEDYICKKYGHVDVGLEYIMKMGRRPTVELEDQRHVHMYVPFFYCVLPIPIFLKTVDYYYRIACGMTSDKPPLVLARYMNSADFKRVWSEWFHSQYNIKRGTICTMEQQDISGYMVEWMSYSHPKLLSRFTNAQGKLIWMRESRDPRRYPVAVLDPITCTIYLDPILTQLKSEKDINYEWVYSFIILYHIALFRAWNKDLGRPDPKKLGVILRITRRIKYGYKILKEMEWTLGYEYKRLQQDYLEQNSGDDQERIRSEQPHEHPGSCEGVLRQDGSGARPEGVPEL